MRRTIIAGWLAVFGLLAVPIGGHAAHLTTTAHEEYTGTAPTLSACGTSPTRVGNDNVGKITVGTGAATSCTVTFVTAWTNAPVCLVMNETTEQTMKTATTTTAITITSATDFAADVVAYICEGRR